MNRQLKLEVERKAECPAHAWPGIGGELVERIRLHDWASTPLGPLESWSPRLRAVVELMLDSPEPACLLWGAEALHLYNDAFVPLLNVRHPHALGRSFGQVWPEAAHLREARFENVLRTGRSVVVRDRPYLISIDGTTKERFYDVSVTPVRASDGGEVEAVLQRLFDTTERVETERRLRYADARLSEDRASLTLQLTLADAMRDESVRQRAQVKSRLQDREEHLRLALITGHLATWDWNLQSGKVLWSDEHFLMQGYHIGEVEPSFDAWAERIHPDDRSPTLAALERALRERREFVHRFRIVHPDGSVHWASARGRYFHDASSQPARMIGVVQDITEEVRAEARLRDIERRQRALIEGLPQFIWRASEDGQWSWCSPQWRRHTGLTEEESLGHRWMMAVHPEDRSRVRAAWRDAVRKGTFDLEYRIGHVGENRYRWFQTRATPIRNDEHDIVEWFGTSTDVDELRDARERQNLLVAELQHRTRNLIGLVKSIARQTLKENDSLTAFSSHFNDRLGALSRVQGLLSRGESESITLGELIHMELATIGANSVRERVHAYGPTVHLQTSVVQTFALAIHELLTNALKYGSLLTPEGRLYVTWNLREDSSGRTHLHLEWMESATPKDAPMSSRTGYGRELIEQMLPYVLDARTRFEITPRGVYCTIDTPLRASGSTGMLQIAAAT